MVVCLGEQVEEEKRRSSQDVELLDIFTNLRGPFVPQGWKNNLLLHSPAKRPQQITEFSSL